MELQQRETAAAAPPVVERKLPGDGGKELRALLTKKVGLQKYLQGLQKQPVLVSIDVLDDKWIFVVRGMRPPIAWWEDYPIYWIQSGNVWSETLTIRK